MTRLMKCAPLVAACVVAVSTTPARAITFDSAEAEWTDVVGGEYVMQTSVGPFEAVMWGDPGPWWTHWDTNEKSGMGFASGSQQTFASGDMFKIGTFAHQNRKIDDGSAITSAKLNIDMVFSTPAGFNSNADFTIEVDETPTQIVGWKKLLFWWKPIWGNPDDRVGFGTDGLILDEFVDGSYKYTLEVLGFRESHDWTTPVLEYFTPEKQTSYLDLVGKVTKSPLGPNPGPGPGPEVTPEPATAALAMLGGVAMLARRRRTV